MRLVAMGSVRSLEAQRTIVAMNIRPYADVVRVESGTGALPRDRVSFIPMAIFRSRPVGPTGTVFARLVLSVVCEPLNSAIWVLG